MIVVSFYTENTIYEKEVEDLRTSCEILGIEHFIQPRKDLGCWEKNCAQKPLFLLECLETFDRPLLWVDADGIILQKPTLEFKGFDLALYFNNRKTKHARNGTIYISPTQAAKRFMKLWYETLQKINRSSKLTPDQPVMISLLRKESLKIADLPLEYTQVFDRDPLSLERAVILHFQASRTARMPPLFWRHLRGRDLKAMRMGSSPYRFFRN